MNAPSESELEIRAAEERRRLHESVSALKSKVRESLDVKKNLREHVLAASGMAAFLGLILGYSFAEIFTD